MNDTLFQIAFREALQAEKADEVPVGAVIFDTKSGEVIARAHNQVEEKQNPMAHAEIIVIQKACRKLKRKFLDGYSIFVTLEPCTMCAGAIAWARLDNLYYGASDPKTGAVAQGPQVFSHSQTHHKIVVQGGIHAEECGAVMTRFFKGKRHG